MLRALLAGYYQVLKCFSVLSFKYIIILTVFHLSLKIVFFTVSSTRGSSQTSNYGKSCSSSGYGRDTKIECSYLVLPD